MRHLTISKQITHRSESSINLYFQEISRFPIISVEEEVDLTIKIRNGDTAALNKLVVSNLRFVVSVAKQYQNQGLSFPDLINEGNVGLVKAAKKFDETRGFKFISYAVWWIRQSIIQAISEQTRVVRLPINRVTSINRINKAIPHLEQRLEREPTMDEIAGYLEISDEEICIVNDIRKRQVSFDMPLSKDDNNDFNLYDVIQAGNLPSPDNELMHESVAINISRALNKLSKREASIIEMSFGLNNSQALTLHDIAEKFEMSSERIRQIKCRGIVKLRSLLKKQMCAY